ncbi:efflux RND transporter permease subunit [Chitinophaga sp. 30R24]|uniref:efflux RND transporter permease subunit n=1 Tax=Chitinophaga sp. 30R24 TaxID=3248838 RepID=UPI003B90AF44
MKMHLPKYAIRNQLIILILFLVAVAYGFYCFLYMPRTEDPNIVIRQAAIITPYAGADEITVENEISKEVEKILFSYAEVKKEKTVTVSKPGVSFTTVELNNNVKSPSLFWARLQHDLNTSSIRGAVVNTEFADVTAIMLNISSDKRSYAELDACIDKLEDRLKTLSEVTKLHRYGGVQQEIKITLIPGKLKSYQITISDIVMALQQNNITASSGKLETLCADIPLYVNARYNTQSEISNQIIRSRSGETVRLRDIARVERNYRKPTAFIRTEAEKAMMLTLCVRDGNNVVEFGKKLNKEIAAVQRLLPDDVKINPIVSQPDFVRSTIWHFIREFGISIAAVIGVIMLMLPLRVALIPAIIAPIAIIITFAILHPIGIEIHQVTLAALIICLGMAIDDPIVVVDAYLEKIDAGMARRKAAWLSAEKLFPSLFVATLAILFSFFPLMFTLTGLSKEFIAPLPICVAIMLAVSLLSSITITPILCARYIRKGVEQEATETGKDTLMGKIQKQFARIIKRAFDYPKTTVAIAVFVVLISLVGGLFVRQELFPYFDRRQFNVLLRLPSNATLEQTAIASKLLKSIIKKDEEVERVDEFIGQSSPRYQTTYAPEPPAQNFAQLFITTTSEEATKLLAKKYLKTLTALLPGVEVQVRELSFNQTPAPVELRITGENLDTLKNIASALRGIVKRADGTNYIRIDYGRDYTAIDLQPLSEAMAKYGVTNDNIIQTVATATDGLPVMTKWEGNKPVSVALYLDDQGQTGMNRLLDIPIPGQNIQVPLHAVASLNIAQHTGQIVRRNGIRTLTVMAEAQQGIPASDIIRALQKELQSFPLPYGYRVDFGGEAEAVKENMPGMITALLLSFLLIFATVLIYYRSIRQALIVLSTFVWSLPGALLGLLLTNNPFGFTGFMGLIALVGIVIRNGIIKIDYANQLVREGMSIKDAAMASALRRMRPIFLTSIVTAIGVTPMVVGRSPLWSPLASVLCFGTLASMFMTLLVIPVLYYLLMSKKIKKKHLSIRVSRSAVTIVVTVLIICTYFQGTAQQRILSLKDCKELAMQNNRQLLIGSARVQMADAQAEEATTAARPQIDAGATGFTFGNPINDILPGNGLYVNAGVMLPIYAGGRIRKAKIIADVNAQIAKEQFINDKAELLLRVEKAYWLVIAANAAQSLADSFALQLQEMRKEAATAVQAGFKQANDLLKIDAALEDNVLLKLQAINNAEIAQMTLAQLIGIRSKEISLVTEDIVTAKLQPLHDIDAAINNRAIIHGMDYALDLTKQQRKMLEAERMPTLIINTGGVYFTGKSIGSMSIIPPVPFAAYYGLISLKIPIWDAGRLRKKIKTQEQRIFIAATELEIEKEQLGIAIRKAILHTTEATALLSAAKVRLAQTEENKRITQNQYEAGFITLKDYLQAQTEHQRARIAIIQAKTEINIRMAELQCLKGDTVNSNQ